MHINTNPNGQFDNQSCGTTACMDCIGNEACHTQAAWLEGKGACMSNEDITFDGLGITDVYPDCTRF